jgi:hypothetical protein
MKFLILRYSLITFLCFASSAIAGEERSSGGVVVTAKDLLPIKVMYQTMGKGYSYVLQVSETEIQLQRWNSESKLLTVAAMPIEMKQFEEALTGIPKDYFRGTVIYRNPYARDGGTVRMITKLGDISEYLVFGWGKDENDKWPQAILRLEPVFKQFNSWSQQLAEIEKATSTKK